MLVSRISVFLGLQIVRVLPSWRVEAAGWLPHGKRACVRL